MGKPSPPPAPDYAGAAREQGQANLQAGQQTASLSNPNIVNPYGSQTITYTPTGPDGNMQPNIVQSLNPQAQQTLDAQQRVQTALANLGEQGVGQARGILGQPFQYNGPGIQTSLNMPGLDTSGIAKMPVNAGATGQQAIMARLQPQIEQTRAANAQRLANQGIRAGSEAWNNEMRAQNQQENDAFSQAALQGLGLDMSANAQGYNQALQSAEFANNQALQSAQFRNTAAQQALAQQLGLYNQPLNQITALMSGSQIQAPQFQGYQGANISAAPLFQATQAKGMYDQNAYAQKMAGYNSMVGGLANIGAGAFTGGFFG